MWPSELQRARFRSSSPLGKGLPTPQTSPQDRTQAEGEERGCVRPGPARPRPDAGRAPRQLLGPPAAPESKGSFPAASNPVPAGRAGARASRPESPLGFPWKRVLNATRAFSGPRGRECVGSAPCRPGTALGLSHVPWAGAEPRLVRLSFVLSSASIHVTRGQGPLARLPSNHSSAID